MSPSSKSIFKIEASNYIENLKRKIVYIEALKYVLTISYCLYCKILTSEAKRSRDRIKSKIYVTAKK